MYDTCMPKKGSISAANSLIRTLTLTLILFIYMCGNIPLPLIAARIGDKFPPPLFSTIPLKDGLYICVCVCLSVYFIVQYLQACVSICVTFRFGIPCRQQT